MTGELDRIKRDVDLSSIVRESGVELRRIGAELQGRCPWHEDKTPSLSVNPGKGVWRCFSCRVGGSVFDWVMKRDGVSFSHAKAILRDYLPSVGNPSPLSRKPTREDPAVLKPATASDRERLRWVAEQYHQLLLTGTTPANEYLASRGIDDPEAIATFKLGFSDRSLGYRLPSKVRDQDDDPRGLMMRIGILRETGHEHFAGSLVIPVFDDEGNVVEMYGRKVNRNLRTGTPMHLYLPTDKRLSTGRGVWNAASLDGKEDIILCESLIDALTFWCAGFRNVTTTYGADVFGQEFLDTFQKKGVERVLIAFDRDEAGDKGAALIAKRLSQEGIESRRVVFPHRLDANAYAQRVKPASKSLRLLLDAAVPMETPTPLVCREPEATEREKAVVIVSTEPAPESAEPSLSAASTQEKPSPLRPQVEAKVSETEVVIELGDRHYRIRGLGRNMSYDLLKVNVLAARGGVFHVDTFDLYSARYRQTFVKAAAQELKVSEDVLKRDLGKVLLKLEELQDAQIKKTLEPKEQTVTLSESERKEALALLRSPNLLDRVLSDLEACGLVGETTNKLACYLATVSRKQPKPLAIMVQSSSAAGKSMLMEAVLALVPKEDRIQYSAMTGQSLFYMGEKDMKHKVLAIAEEEGASRASYALKLLQSEGEISIASTGKDPATGRLLTHEYVVKGPVMLFLTTTAIELDDELLNRCIVLTVDEGREQTRAIHRLQREQETIEGILARENRQRLLKLHQNAQRLLQPLRVSNPFARRLTFLDTQTQTRRDQPKYLALIRAITLLHQHQRPRKTMVHRGEEIEYLEVTLDDIAMANRLANEVLGRSLEDLPPQTRCLLNEVDGMVTNACEQQRIDRRHYRFTRRDVRQYTGWKDSRLKKHLVRLEELEYLVAHRQGSRFHYELIYEGQGQDGGRFLPGLVDVAELGDDDCDGERSRVNGDRSRVNGEKSPPGHPQVTPKSRGGHGGLKSTKPLNGNGSRLSAAKTGENAQGDSWQKPPSKSSRRRNGNGESALAGD